MALYVTLTGTKLVRPGAHLKQAWEAMSQTKTRYFVREPVLKCISLFPFANLHTSTSWESAFVYIVGTGLYLVRSPTPVLGRGERPAFSG